jgi:hypothetical protein
MFWWTMQKGRETCTRWLHELVQNNQILPELSTSSIQVSRFFRAGPGNWSYSGSFAEVRNEHRLGSARTVHGESVQDLAHIGRLREQHY